jgi:flagella basal body P-ring formation protein FlgA
VKIFFSLDPHRRSAGVLGALSAPVRRALAPLSWLPAWAVACAAGSAGVAAATTATGLQAGHLAQAETLAREAAAALAPPGARIEARAGVPDPRWRLAPCAQVQAHLAAGSAPWGHTRVGLRCIGGAIAWNVYLPMTVQVHAPAWVARSALPAGIMLQPEHLQRATVDWAAEASPAFGELQALQGRILAQPVRAGQALRGRQLQVRRWFRAGQTVEVVAVGAGFSVSSSGRALSDGVEGRPARVRTEAGRVLVGRPTADARLEIRL